MKLNSNKMPSQIYLQLIDQLVICCHYTLKFTIKHSESVSPENADSQSADPHLGPGLQTQPTDQSMDYPYGPPLWPTVQNNLLSGILKFTTSSLF